jgi:hypothetical protein
MSLVLHGGHGKSIFVTRDAIRIVQEHQTERHDKGIPFRHIASVEVKKPGAFDGYIQFSIAGGRPHDSAFTLTGGTFDAARDDNAVTFSSHEDYDVALKIKLLVESWSAHPPFSPADEVRKLKTLADEGALTAEEFAAAKKHVLGL